MITASRFLRRVLSLALLFGSALLTAQQAYWQQEMRYRMQVRLDDSLHLLKGHFALTYINHSPHTLDQVYLHLWPNAYRNRHTALSRQLTDQGNTDLHYAREKDLGYIDSLRFAIDGTPAQLVYDPEHIDIALIRLRRPLQPGDSVLITTPFVVKIPDSRFSRLGHDRQAYYLTQWYPKPAVFDRNGWHPMPYLDQGEFYSEFGSYDVSITLPGNYVVAATGDRVADQVEGQFMAGRISDTEKFLSAGNFKTGERFPRSSAALKTVRFVQRNVHDFAWFADKRLLVKGDSVKLASGRVVQTFIYFTPENSMLWKDACTYINRAVLFYSDKVGEYPFRHASAVDGTIMAGGGMEYPNITVVGNTGSAFELELVIAHEVGHNWFYGLLGSNERDHPFMDEGLNSFYELRYVRHHYPGKGMGEAFLGVTKPTRLLNLDKLKNWMYHDLSYGVTLRKRTTQPMDLSSELYTEENYGAIVYSKTAVVFDHLLQLNGDKLDTVMKAYFRRFCFKHPAPGDLEDLLVENGIADRETYKALTGSTRPIDYALRSAKKTGDLVRLRVTNRSGIAAPFVVGRISDGVVTGSAVIPGFTGTRTFTVAGGGDRYRLDPEQRMPEINRNNNTRRVRGLLRGVEPLRLKLLTALEDPSKTNLFYLPAAGVNHYNGVMLGLALHNYGVFQKRFEWAVVPMYAFRSRSPAGLADVEYKFFPAALFSQVNVGAGMRTFALHDQSFYDSSPGFAHYYRLAPYAELLLRREPLSKVSQKILVMHHLLKADSSAGAAWDPFRTLPSWQVTQLKYSLRNARTLHPYAFSIDVQRAGEVIKTGFTGDLQVDLGARANLLVRCFAGTFIGRATDARSAYAFRASGHNGSRDYALTGHFLGRNETGGLGFSQFMEADGNLKTWTSLGQSTTWLAALNVKSPRIYGLPFRVFADAVICDPLFLAGDPVLWDAGINLVVWRDIIEVYYGLIYNADVRESLDKYNITPANRIRFTFNIDKLVPKRLLREFSF